MTNIFEITDTHVILICNTGYVLDFGHFILRMEQELTYTYQEYFSPNLHNLNIICKPSSRLSASLSKFWGGQLFPCGLRNFCPFTKVNISDGDDPGLLHWTCDCLDQEWNKKSYMWFAFLFNYITPLIFISFFYVKVNNQGQTKKKKKKKN